MFGSDIGQDAGAKDAAVNETWSANHGRASTAVGMAAS